MYQPIKAFIICIKAQKVAYAIHNSQGCILSSLPFNLFINDLYETLTRTGV